MSTTPGNGSRAENRDSARAQRPAAAPPPTAPGICVIMAGGRGTRFWPLSRAARPKQLLALATGTSLLRDTFERVVPLVGAERVLVVTSGDLAAAVRADLPELPAMHVITEPVGRTPAPCAVLGMGLARRLDPRAPVALLPADHLVRDGEAFRAQLAAAFAAVRAEPAVATFGIRPTHPHTGYGYIEAAAGPSDGPLPGVAFSEKPDRATAARYVAGGRHYWNSGIFVWNQDWFGAMADRFLADVRRLMQVPVETFGTESFAEALQDAYGVCPAASIDKAIMEKIPGFTVVPAAFDWSDLGDWEAWGELAGELAGDNLGRGDVVAVASRGNIVRGDGRLIALVGVDDLVVVDTPDALLVCRRGQAEKLREVVGQLEKDGRRDLV
ncbi:mannose-1-phosphate guanylyltransferase [bacterium]|nr:mannose-1-phosphate guanylyltransferase [bacterium]